MPGDFPVVEPVRQPFGDQNNILRNGALPFWKSYSLTCPNVMEKQNLLDIPKSLRDAARIPWQGDAVNTRVGSHRRARFDILRPVHSITYNECPMARHLVPGTRLLLSNREPERTHDVSGRCPLSSRGSGSHSLKQWAAGAPVIGAAPVPSGRPKRPRVEGLPASGALQLFLSKAREKGKFEIEENKHNESAKTEASPVRH